MKNAIWATWFHKGSTDEKPQHHLCPVGEESWCRFQKAEATGSEYSHKHALPESIMETIKPTYTRLSDDELLKKCLDCITPNANESLNHVIWNRCPKDTFVGAKRIRWAAADAVSTFYDGLQSRKKVLALLKISDRDITNTFLAKVDRKRLSQVHTKCSPKGVAQRQRRRNIKKGFEEAKKSDRGGNLRTSFFFYCH
ncbi:hypothetical protein BSL78_22459 [Apostichopus japonicus]|uniref:Uncharacterized protein n=1 Tax=Stichopus japonicus TaxID=307972 RepID=A0A2G8JYA8_STIJA|nr:hypothetical protein BSL78_22459 [Apostichopus japonicus]